MTWLYLLGAATVGLAWWLSCRRPEHFPAAWVLSAGLAADAARRVLRVSYLDSAIERLGWAHPWTGAPRLAALAYHALTIVWPAALAAGAVAVYLGRGSWLVGAGYVAAVAFFAVAHPYAGDGSLQRALTTCELVSLLVALGSLVTWYRSPSREPTTTAQAVLLVLVTGEIGSLAGAWRLDLFGRWDFSRFAFALTRVVALALQGGYLWKPRSS
jgi:hypothetical protein